MAIRIDRIRVNRGGPLGADFVLEPGDLNLICGHNETGKTYVVESMIKFLFRTSSRAPVGWNLRDWEIAGRVVVSGLEDDRVCFTKTGRKLEDYWEAGTGLPRDLSRLLVVKAGETLLAKEEKDSVGRGILKDYLSGEGLLDEIAARISSTLQDTTVQDGQPDGPQRGEIRNRKQLRQHLDNMDALLSDVEEGYASGEVYLLRKQKEKIETELDMLRNARRHHAWQLHEKIHSLRQKRELLPDENKLAGLESDIRVYELKKAEVKSKSDTLKNLEITSDNYLWAKNALNNYQEIVSGLGVSGPKPMFMFFALFFLVGAVVTGLLGLSIPLVLCAAGSVVFFILHYMGTRRALTRAGESMELENVKAEFQNRFGSKLTDRAALQAQLDRLDKNHHRASVLKEDLDKLTPDISSRETSITETLKVWTDIEPSPQEWRDTIGELRNNITGLEYQTNSLDRELASLNVPEEEYLDQDPGAKWDPGRYATLKEELKKTEQALNEEENELERLKSLVSQMTSSESFEWEELITALREKREAAAQEYRQLTAEILAKVQVNAVIQRFRKEENSRIAEGLKREELTEPLHTLTGRYSRIRQEEDRGLILVTDEDEEYPLAVISTGAQEQTFLALRMGFASIAMKGQTAFLILDDAFQHSDWPRRERLVTHILNLVDAGWQVFYFTMDDHIRDLFLDKGGTLGDRFRSLELC